MSLDRHFKQGPMFGCSDRMCCGVYPPEDTDHCPECMVEWPCEVELLRRRAEQAEAALARVRDLCDAADVRNPSDSYWPAKVRAAVEGDSQ